jgi:hypothetical protein
MKHCSMICLVCLLILSPLSAYGELRSELLWRRSKGTLTSEFGSDHYQGTELDLRLTSFTWWDDMWAVTLFGGMQRAMTLSVNGTQQDISTEPLGWYYGTGTAFLLPLGPALSGEVNLSYEMAWQFIDARELRLDTFRVGVKTLTYTESGILFSVGAEYSRPIWGRLFDRSGDDVQVVRFRYNASGFALSIGVGFYAW